MSRWLCFLAVAFCVAPAVAQATVPSGNLVLNPGADEAVGETDSTGLAIPHWGTSGRLSAVKYGAGTGFPTTADGSSIGGGANFFSGGINDTTSIAEQFVDVSAAQPEIDAGRVSVVLSAYLGGSLMDGDNTTVVAKFEDEHSDNVFGLIQIGPVTAGNRGNQTTLLRRSASADVPPGTFHIRLTITANRTDGQHNNGYADNVSVTLEPDAKGDAATVAQDAAATPVDVLANDRDVNGVPRKVASVTQPAHGTVAITGGGTGLTYAPAAHYCNGQGGAPDTFTYTLNSGGTATVTMTVTCSTNPPPDATTGAATVIFPGTATLNGVVNPRGSATAYHFEYGTSPAYGSSTPDAAVGAGTTGQAVSVPLSGLAGNTTYHFRVVATNAAGTTPGADREFQSAAFGCGAAGAVPKLAAFAPVTAAASVNGTAGPDRIVGTLGNDTVSALGGDDCVIGLGGNDVIDAGAGDDRVDADGICPPGTKEPSFCLSGGGGNDRVTGGSGDDIVDGGQGNDTLTGSEGADRLRGGSGNDRVSGGDGRDIVTGHAGNDRLSGGSGEDRLSGESGEDNITGGSGADDITGGSGNDSISARDSAGDRIDCGSGRDRVTADRLDRVASNCEHVTRRR